MKMKKHSCFYCFSIIRVESDGVKFFVRSCLAQHFEKCCAKHERTCYNRDNISFYYLFHKRG